MPLITVLGPAGPPVSYRFGGECVRIGRAPESDLVLHDPSISRRHAELTREGEGWVVRDLRSQNGTRLAGRLVVSAEAVAPGDRIELGTEGTVLVFDREVEGAVAEGAARETLRDTNAERGAGRDDGVPELVGDAPALRALLEELAVIAPSDAPVLLTGETGTGKELVARLVHARSGRGDGPFVVVNCPAVPPELFESEVFGVEKGVATGVSPRLGLLEHAAGGTVLLDEIGDLGLAAQSKILRFVQERTLRRVGGSEERPVDVRVVAATHHDLAADVAAGSFRADLFHRLDVLRLHLPPLRERRDDIPSLARHLLSRRASDPPAIGADALEALRAHDWPGNVRELDGVLTRAALLARAGGTIELAHLPVSLRGATSEPHAVEATWQRLVSEPGSFWSLVRAPFLARELPKDAAAQLVARAHREGGGSYRGAADLLGLADQYKKFVNFVHHHGLGPDPDGDDPS